jgi:invasion protein IalB
MDHRLVFAPARPAACALAVSAATTMLAALIGSAAFAQAPPAPALITPAAPKPAPKAAPKAAPAQKPAETPAPQAQQQPQAQAEQPQLTFSPWTKFCLGGEASAKQKGEEANAIHILQICFTGKDGRVESGMPVVAAMLIEPENNPKKVLRVTFPLGMSLQPGTRVIVDNRPLRDLLE